jgi:hypothetical protein
LQKGKQNLPFNRAAPPILLANDECSTSQTQIGNRGICNGRLRRVYSVFTKLGDGEFLFVGSREELEQAEQLVQELNDNWPHEYVIRDSKGNDVGPKNG